jgi:hypothetical protein
VLAKGKLVDCEHATDHLPTCRTHWHRLAEYYFQTHQSVFCRLLRLVLTGQAYRTDEPNIDNVFVTETGSAEVYPILCWDGDNFADCRGWEERHLD